MMRFERNYTGLQILWQDVREHEFLGQALLQGAAASTTARSRWQGQEFYYHYPIVARFESAELLIISYSQRPTEWAGKTDFEIEEGNLMVDLSPEHAAHRVRFFSRDGVRSDLVKGSDWIYTPPKLHPNELIEPRGTRLVSRIERPRQRALRSFLLAENVRCQFTGTQCAETLEACHILPVKNGGRDVIENCLLLRRDVHSLFDAGLIRLRRHNDQWKLALSGSALESEYKSLNGTSASSVPLSSHPYLAARAELEERILASIGIRERV